MPGYLVIALGLGVLGFFRYDLLWLFLPMLAANQAGHIAKLVIPAPYRMTISVRHLGAGKTIDAYFFGPALAAVALFCLDFTDPKIARNALILGIGAVLGDHLKSLVKRKLGMEHGAPFFFDRIDFVLGGGVMALIFMPWVTPWHVLWLAAVAWPIHYVGNKMSHANNWRDTPH